MHISRGHGPYQHRAVLKSSREPDKQAVMHGVGGGDGQEPLFVLAVLSIGKNPRCWQPKHRLDLSAGDAVCGTFRPVAFVPVEAIKIHARG